MISVLSNVAPRQVHDICQFYFDRKVKESATLQLKSIELIELLFSEVNPIPVKTALNLMEFHVRSLRMPLTEME